MSIIQEVTEWEIDSYNETDGAGNTLDLFSTSPTFFPDLCFLHRCLYGAPYFAVERTPKRFRVVQGCCNHWDCPKCGIQVAKQHYGRIVAGAREVAQTSELWFITVTCRGKEVSVETAEKSYLAWTSRFLDACYAKSKRSGAPWVYAQVTEKQKRGHPHSHILTTFQPGDLVDGVVENWATGSDGRKYLEYKDALRSEWLQCMVCSAGLGDQYDISAVREIEAASRYVAKYMFKDTQFSASFPKGWKRVRYSQSWPKLKRKKTNAFVLMSKEDWALLASKAVVVDAEAGDAHESAEYFLKGHDVIIHEVEQMEQREWQSN